MWRRTATLWGLGLTKRVNHSVGFLNDGHARTINEAILWHGGEAEEAKNQYGTLDSRKISLNNMVKSTLRSQNLKCIY